MRPDLLALLITLIAMAGIPAHLGHAPNGGDPVAPGDQKPAPTAQELYDEAERQMREGKEELAITTLERAAAAGFADDSVMRENGLWVPVRKNPRFRAAYKRIAVTRYVAMLDRKDRDAFQRPNEVMKALALKRGERVVDLGAGSGYFTLRAAKAVGKTGVVWALDIEQLLLDTIEAKMNHAKLTNIKLKLVKPDDPDLPPASADTILIVDTWHYVKDRGAYANKLKPALAPGGRVVIIDYTPKPFEERPWGPPPEQQLSRKMVDADMAAAGLKPKKVHDFLPEQYFVEYGL